MNLFVLHTHGMSFFIEVYAGYPSCKLICPHTFLVRFLWTTSIAFPSSYWFWTSFQHIYTFHSNQNFFPTRQVGSFLHLTQLIEDWVLRSHACHMQVIDTLDLTMIPFTCLRCDNKIGTCFLRCYFIHYCICIYYSISI